MEPIASPTWSDLLQTIKEKKYRVSADYLLREIAGEYAIIPVGAACQISNAVGSGGKDSRFRIKLCA